MNTEFLKRLCAIKGTSGAEDGVAGLILTEIEKFVDDYAVDPLGNLIAHKKGPGQKMMLAGHMDQVGMMVRLIDNEGFLRFIAIGYLDPVVLIGCRVIFESGLVGVVDCETLDPPDKKITLDNLYIDVGASSREEAEKRVAIGDICVYDEATVIDHDKIVSPALDDRLGCFIMVEALKRLGNLTYDLYLVFTVQEEIGSRGAKTSAFSIDPDYALAFDATIAADTPKQKKCRRNWAAEPASRLKTNPSFAARR